MRQVSLQLSQSVRYNSSIPHCNDSSGQTSLTVIIKTLWLCLQTNLLHIGDGGCWQTLVRLSTKTIKRWSDSSAITANRLLAWLYVSPDAATWLAASSANGNGPRGVAEVCLLAGQRQRKHSRSNIKNGSSNHHPHTPREPTSRCVCVCAWACVCTSTGVSAVLYL